jgi:hypothetical protein
MRILSLLSTVLAVATTTVTAGGADLATIDRTIVKEPAYKSKPAYCLLFFGPEARTRVWLVLDGDVLYVDRNGNGDLTEEGKRFVAAPEWWGANRNKGRVWKVGDIAAPGAKVTCRRLCVGDIFEAPPWAAFGPGLGITVTVPIGGSDVPQSAGSLVHYPHRFRLHFAARPEDAPVVHFGGPLRIIVLQPERLTGGLKAGARYDLEARVGTPGLGRDTAALLDDTDLSHLVDHDNSAIAHWDFTDRLGRVRRSRTKLVCD